MNKPSYKVITIADIIEWNEKNEIVLNPNYQRNRVWDNKSKSYLIDSIIRNLPIPPIFIRQTINVDSRKITREILDGQQRVSTILEFVSNEFCILKSQNDQYGNMYYDGLDAESKEMILTFEIFAVIINEKDDVVVYDMFSRLNTNNYALTPQEIRNAKYWGEFKVFVYKLSTEYRSFFTESGLFSKQRMARQEDSKFISILVNYLLFDITNDNEKSLNKLYERFDSAFDNSSEIYLRFKQIMDSIYSLWPDIETHNSFNSTGSFYSLFVILDMWYNHKLDLDCNFNQLNKLLIKFNNNYFSYRKNRSSSRELDFALYEYERASSSSSNNKARRLERINIILDYIRNCLYEIR